MRHLAADGQIRLESFTYDAVHGFWCVPCQAETVVFFRWVIFDADTLELGPSGHRWACTECGRQWQ